jgi:ribonuclease P protein component
VYDAAATPPGVAYAVGRSVGGAVVRNRVRRRLRTLVAAEAARAPFVPGYYLLGAAPSAATSSYQQLGDDLGALVARVRQAASRG